ncbi:histidine kinase/DNA gyrase B/HSP90-like ATPase [Krasilnikovia cinnamomea]|uniref:Histidine kinase/DNA gyrase B/HSP90-like ATPase n=1 Tax=Krasilnikovia cinnamomea TaxID=349313 RepID=A0A4V2G750_9ACTN|nr:ATP-binding protein [Krasilnikovia cinnamomea]RZU51206.1 histidine kinase/DNA gyrase B/HSP90-like ATPase [Krasilnikovia cinnamomea]
MTTWIADVPTDGTVELRPDPRALDSLGRNHSLETALADLVDNSIDAGARNVLIRFIRVGTRLTGLYVVDDGRGMTPDSIDTAMTLGGRRRYSGTDLGRFGVGLKAASFSQAASLTVLTRAAGHSAVGRRWVHGDDRASFHCDLVPTAFADAELDRPWAVSTSPSGTVIRWDQVAGFPATDDPLQVRTFLSRAIDHLRGHLGLMFHRILAAGDTRIVIDVEDVDGGVGIPTEVGPLDPFGYPKPPPGWPRTLTADVGDTRLSITCHIWPRRSNTDEYRLPGGAENRQGLYFYRRNRLLHAGGWEGIHAPDKKLQLARASIDIDGDVAGIFTMNPEKSRVTAGPDFARAVTTARADDGTTIADYLQAAESTWVVSNRRATGQRRPVVPPGKGLNPKVVREIVDELPQINDQPLNILWAKFDNDDFFEVDRTTTTLRLNNRYRAAVLGGRRGGLNDAPLLKAVIFLLMENVFQGAILGARDKDNIELWQQILTVAARTELASYAGRS